MKRKHQNAHVISPIAKDSFEGCNNASQKRHVRPRRKVENGSQIGWRVSKEIIAARQFFISNYFREPRDFAGLFRQVAKRLIRRSSEHVHRQHISTVEPQAYCVLIRLTNILTGKCNDLASGTGSKLLRSWRPDKSRFAFPTHLLSDFLPCRRFLLAKFRMSLLCPER